MGLMKRLENIFAAVAFAEEGEAETARQILSEDTKDGKKGKKTDEGRGYQPMGNAEQGSVRP